MHSIVVAACVFACAMGGFLLGMLLRARLHERHFSKEVRDVVGVGTAMVVTLTSLVLGLLVATAKSSFDTRAKEAKDFSAKVVLLDRTLARYGPETAPARQMLRSYFARRIDEAWPPHGRPRPREEAQQTIERFEQQILSLEPTTATQRWLHSQIMKNANDLAATRLQLIEQTSGGSIPPLFLYILAFWVAAVFLSVGLFAPYNPVVLTVLCFSALSVAGAVFLVLEMDQPFSGFIQISSAPARTALAHLGQ
jgi:hypothetical protein